jgi:hypothetical protein
MAWNREMHFQLFLCCFNMLCSLERIYQWWPTRPASRAALYEATIARVVSYSCAQMLISIFGTAYSCESLYSTLEFIKSKYRLVLTDLTLYRACTNSCNQTEYFVLKEQTLLIVYWRNPHEGCARAACGSLAALLSTLLYSVQASQEGQDLNGTHWLLASAYDYNLLRGNRPAYRTINKT